jgi:hypothetical protein
MREEIARIVPFYDGIQHLKKTGDAVQYGGTHLCADGKFPTPGGKAHFRALEVPEIKLRLIGWRNQTALGWRARCNRSFTTWCAGKCFAPAGLYPK